MTYNKALPKEHWYLLKLDPTLEDTFQKTQILAFRRNSNIKDIIVSNKIEFNKVKLKSLTVAKSN